MAGRGRGRAAFPEVRHQLRRPKDDDEKKENTAAGPEGDAKPEICEPESQTPVRTVVPPEDGVLKGICMQLKGVKGGSSDFLKLVGLIVDKAKTKKDVDEVENGIYEVSQSGPEQAEVASQAFAALSDLEVDRYKLRTKLLTRMQLEFEEFEEKAKPSPLSLVCSAIFLCGFYTRYRLHGKPIKPLGTPVWKYIMYMLESREQFYLNQCFELVKSKIKFFLQYNRKEIEELFLPKVQEILLDPKTVKEIQSSALDTMKCIWQAMARMEVQKETASNQPACASNQPA